MSMTRGGHDYHRQTHMGPSRTTTVQPRRGASAWRTVSVTARPWSEGKGRRHSHSHSPRCLQIIRTQQTDLLFSPLSLQAQQHLRRRDCIERVCQEAHRDPREGQGPRCQGHQRRRPRPRRGGLRCGITHRVFSFISREGCILSSTHDMYSSASGVRIVRESARAWFDVTFVRFSADGRAVDVTARTGSRRARTVDVTARTDSGCD